MAEKEFPIEYEICPDDPGIILSSDIRAAHMIAQPGIKLVHVRGAQPIFTEALQRVSTKRFLTELDERLYRPNLRYRVKPDPLSAEETRVLQSIKEHTENSSRRIAGQGIHLLQNSHSRVIRATFNSVADSDGLTTPWHYDQNKENNVAEGILNEGAEYLIGQMTAKEILAVAYNETPLPDHIKIGKSNAGDLLFMVGWTGAFNKLGKQGTDAEILPGCCIHRTPDSIMRAAFIQEFHIPCINR
jgi:hypothetical protein